MYPRGVSILTCPALCLQAGVLLWDISCYPSALGKPQVTQAVLVDEYMCRIIAPLWHMQQHFFKAHDRERTGVLWQGVEEIAFNRSHEPGSCWLAHPRLHGFSPGLGLCVTSVPVTCCLMGRIKARTDYSVKYRLVFYILPWALSTSSFVSLLSQLH